MPEPATKRGVQGKCDIIFDWYPRGNIQKDVEKPWFHCFPMKMM